MQFFTFPPPLLRELTQRLIRPILVAAVGVTVAFAAAATPDMASEQSSNKCWVCATLIGCPDLGALECATGSIGISSPIVEGSVSITCWQGEEGSNPEKTCMDGEGGQGPS